MQLNHCWTTLNQFVFPVTGAWHESLGSEDAPMPCSPSDPTNSAGRGAQQGGSHMKVPGKRFFFWGGGGSKTCCSLPRICSPWLQSILGRDSPQGACHHHSGLGDLCRLPAAPWLVLVPPGLGWVQDITLVPSSFDAFSKKKNIPCSTTMGWSTTRTLHRARGGGCRKEEGMEAGEGAGGNI